MKPITSLVLFIGLFVLPLNAVADRTSPLIIDHTSADINMIPESAIAWAKADLHIAYQHTSHGSQIITGMNALRDFPEFGSTFNWGDAPDDDAILDLQDLAMPDGVDLSAGEYQWYDATRAFLNNSANADVNVIMWSWCDIKGHDIAYYLDRMEALIEEYGQGSSSHPVPVRFVFMTGHANGGGEGDSSDAQNELIRAHCIANNRILFDFADIENYDPDHQYFLDKNVDDALYYDSDGNGTKDSNWASEYLAAHPASQLDLLVNGTAGYGGCGSCSHSPGAGETNDAKLNCVLKGRAIWWLWARLAGWGECLTPPSELNAVADRENRRIDLSWLDNASDPNEDGFIIQRRLDNGPWENAYAHAAADTTVYTDSDLDAGFYQYRVAAFLDDDGEGLSCDDAPSNVVTVQLESADLCPQDPDKTDPGQCGCGYPEIDGCNFQPEAPELITPNDGSSDTSLLPTMTTGEFQDTDSDDRHGQTIWQISKNSDFSATLYNETTDENLTVFKVPEPLEEATTYYWRVSYVDIGGAQSQWSDTFSFSTESQEQALDSDLDNDPPDKDVKDVKDIIPSDSGGSSGCFIGAGMVTNR